MHVWANLLIQIDEVAQPNFVTRSDGSVNTISFTGSVREIGGTGEVFENLVMYIGNGSDCQGGREGAFCFGLNGLSWTNGNFSLDATAPKELSVGAQSVFIDIARNDTLYLNAASTSQNIFLQVDATIDVDITPIVEDEQEDIIVSLTIEATDTKEVLRRFRFRSTSTTPQEPRFGPSAKKQPKTGPSALNSTARIHTAIRTLRADK